MRRNLLLILAVCIAKIGFSQTDFRKGYVFTNAGDTLSGLVKFGGDNAYKLCEFKKSDAQEIVTYEPAQIRGYGFENDKYFDSKERIGSSSELVFYEVIVRGLVTLYGYEDAYFISKDGGTLLPLVNEAEIVVIDGKNISKNSNQHVVTMNMMMFDCAKLRGKIQNTRLSERDLTKLIEDYNKCSGAPYITYKAAKPWIKVLTGVSGGMNISTIKFESQNISYKYLFGSFDASISPMANISFDILSPKKNEHISLHVELLYSAKEYYSFYKYETFSTIETNDVTIALQELKIPFGFQYTFFGRRFNPYFNIGMSQTYNLNTSSTWIRESELKLTQVVETTNGEALDIPKSQFGYWGGIGLRKSLNGKLSAYAELRFEQTNGLPIDPKPREVSVDSKILNFQFILGIRTK